MLILKAERDFQTTSGWNGKKGEHYIYSPELDGWMNNIDDRETFIPNNDMPTDLKGFTMVSEHHQRYKFTPEGEDLMNTMESLDQCFDELGIAGDLTDALDNIRNSKRRLEATDILDIVIDHLIPIVELGPITHNYEFTLESIIDGADSELYTDTQGHIDSLINMGYLMVIPLTIESIHNPNSNRPRSPRMKKKCHPSTRN